MGNAAALRRVATNQALFLLFVEVLVAGFFAALRAVAFAGASPFLSRLFFSSAMKSTTLVVASWVAAFSSSTCVVAPFAFMATRLATNHVLRQAADLGRINLANLTDPGPGSGLVVLALGKHGAGELNY